MTTEEKQKKMETEIQHDIEKMYQRIRNIYTAGWVWSFIPAVRPSVP